MANKKRGSKERCETIAGTCQIGAKSPAVVTTIRKDKYETLSIQTKESEAEEMPGCAGKRGVTEKRRMVSPRTSLLSSSQHRGRDGIGRRPARRPSTHTTKTPMFKINGRTGMGLRTVIPRRIQLKKHTRTVAQDYKGGRTHRGKGYA